MIGDRLTALLEQPVARLTGIDFVRIVDPGDQHELDIYFLLDPETLEDPFSATPLAPGAVTITPAESAGSPMQVSELTLAVGNGGRTVVRVRVAARGGFERYRLRVADPRVDRFFSAVELSFKQACPTDFDCAPHEPECPDDGRDPVLDLLARDFVSLRGALLDAAAVQVPDWRERIPADVGVMYLELLAALGDELSYIQDRFHRETHLATATQRRSVRHLLRLVDYELDNGAAAATWLDVTVRSGGLGLTAIAAGDRVWSPPIDGEPPIPFEVGEGVTDALAGRTFTAHEAWNQVPLYLPDPAEPCLPLGATEAWLDGHVPAATDLPVGVDPLRFFVGRTVLLRSDPTAAGAPARRHLIRVREVEHASDPLDLVGGMPRPITRLAWERDGALPFELPVADTVLRANLVPATAGERITELMVVGESEDLPASERPRVRRAVERQGPYDELRGERSVAVLYSMRATEHAGLGWLPGPAAPLGLVEGEAGRQRPELAVEEIDAATLDSFPVPRWWDYQRTLLGSRPESRHVTLEDGTWRRIIGFRRGGEEIVHEDYATGRGATLRFGDGELGAVPAPGTVFRVTYRTGPGTQANLAPDTITHRLHPLDPGIADPLAAIAAAVTNPLAVTSGRDAEPLDVAKHLGPEAFRAITHRAVREGDYAEIAERLPWVQRAGARFRWTGSWLSAFATADPLDADVLSPPRRRELEAMLECVRQAGREVIVRDPSYLDLDLVLALCVTASAYAGQVIERVTEALTGPGPHAFFHPDNFSFGTPLHRSRLEAAIQRIAGVLAVDRISIRERGRADFRELTETNLPVAPHQLIRLANDPRYPERGSLRVLIEGDR